MPKEKRLFLLDAMALIYRAYFALNKNPRINSKGLNTSAVLGFANSLLDILKNEDPTHIGVAFDTFAPTHREADFTDYKAHREKMPEDIALALPYIRKLIEGFSIPILEVEGYEADDVIGTLARKAGQEGYTTFMVTPDKDFGQLVAEKTFIYKPPRMGNKADILGVKEVLERYQIERPEQLTDILGLWGDASDNIPGIPGIGEKRAMELIRQYGSIENLLEHSGELQGKIRENVETYAEQGLMSKQLATIIQDVPVEFQEEQLRVKSPDQEALEELFNELEFRTFSRRVFGEEKDLLPRPEVPGKQQPQLFDLQEGIAMGSPDPGIKSIKDLSVSYHLVSGDEEIEALTGRLKEEPVFCFDTETTGLNPDNAELVGISFAFQPGEAFFVILPENFGECHDVVSRFKPFLEDRDKLKIGQNMKFDIAMLRWYDVEVSGRMFDTMLAHYLIEPDLRHNIDFLAETYLRYQKIPTEALIGKKGKEQLVMRQVDTLLLKDYACEDADITLQLYFKLDPLLGAGSLRRIFDEIEMPLVPVLASMEAEGVKLDTTALNEYSVELASEIVEVEKQVHALAGQEFNIASPQQLGKILFEKLRITDNPSRTQTKQYSTGEDVLQKLINRHPVVQLILDYRSLTKLKSTYVDTLPQLVSPRDNRVHTTYNQAVAATGRLSSNNPNLQNIPIRSERGREIRKAFVPRRDGYILLSADYSQIELRIIAELSGDEAMQEAFRHGLDIHTATASKVYGVPIDLVSPEMRRNAKMVNFGIVYGISAFGLSERLGIPRREAGEIINAYFSQYPGVREYMDKTISKARENGYVETILGRRRYIRDINSSNATVRGFAERNAINAPIQGSSADMIKIAMISIYEEFSKRNLKSKMILQVHDELVFDAHRDEIGTIRPIIMEKMVNAIPMKVPVVVEMNTGGNWLEAH